MFKDMTEQEAREQIKTMVAEYYHAFKEKKEPFKKGNRITYAARVYDEKEMCALTDATLDFWLTTGRFTEQFDSESFDTILQQLDFHKCTWKGNEADVKKGHFISIY